MKKQPTMIKVPETKAEILEYERKNMLTVDDLIKYLKTFPKNALIYTIESNTGTYQCVPDVSYICGSLKDEKKRLRGIYKGWYKHDDKKEMLKKTNERLKEIFKYAYDKDALCVCL